MATDQTDSDGRAERDDDRIDMKTLYDRDPAEPDRVEHVLLGPREDGGVAEVRVQMPAWLFEDFEDRFGPGAEDECKESVVHQFLAVAAFGAPEELVYEQTEWWTPEGDE